MSDIRLANQAEPPTPPTGRTIAYVDSADKKLKTKDDAGLVIDMVSGGREYLFAQPSAEVTYSTGNLTPGDVSNWNTTVASSGSNITNNEDGTFTLLADRTYKLIAEATDANVGTSGEIDFEWVDAANAVLPGVKGLGVNWTGGTDNITSGSDSQSDALAVFTPSVDTTVKIRFTGSKDFAMTVESRVWIEVL